MIRNKKLKKFQKIVKKVRSYQANMKAMSDIELAGLTEIFKRRLKEGESLEDLLPEAYAAICEADYRILGKAPYDVQILGAVALHYGNLIEMNTGEGKTLVGTLALYLNALTGKSNILLTTNEYLALRDKEEMAPVYEFMGLTVDVGVSEKTEERFTNDRKREIYAADIVYTTHGALGFDYLLNNLVTSASDRFLREFNYVIIDEADSVLLDSAQTPLVISGSPRVQSNLYELADFFVTTLIEGRDYEKAEKKVWLTEQGIRYTEQFFQISNFYGEEYFEINRHVMLALRAHFIFEIEKEYMLTKEHKLQLLDSGSGRMMPGVKLRGGQHQALEAKERLPISKENRSVASVTYQNLFLLFPKISGMSGTISDAREELNDVYGLDVVVIPPNRPLRRKDLKDCYYKTADCQFTAAMDVVFRTHRTGQPVLIVVSTIAETELVSKLLMEEQIPHNVLNANNAFWEAGIIKEAGQMNAVTVATSMAGRGTDICLGEGVEERGGLAVIGIGRMANIRQERQARGRAGRQGAPGFSRFYVSLQDEVVMRNHIKAEKYASREGFVSTRKMKKIINSAQQNGEENAVISRKQAVNYDQVLKRQRELIYKTRNSLLDGLALDDEKIKEIAKKAIEYFLEEEKKRDLPTLSRYILDNISYQLDDRLTKIVEQNYNDKLWCQYLMQMVEKGINKQAEKLQDKEKLHEFVRMAMLNAIDDAWVEQVDYLQQLQAAVLGRSFAQRNPVLEYQRDALESFKKMEKIVLRNMMRNILLSDVSVDAEKKLRILLP